MPAHPHAALMADYAQDALSTNEPHLLWEHKINGEWTPCTITPVWYPMAQYRRKQKYILINGYEVPEPERKMPTQGTKYYLALPCQSGHPCYHFNNGRFDTFYLNAGLVHLTQQAAEIHAHALMSFTAIPDATEGS